jgi:hypothetical protein
MSAKDADKITKICGFGDAISRTGWVDFTDEGMTFNNWERHNGESAKKRAMDSERKSAKRRQNVRQESGQMSAEETDKSRTEHGLEKRREEEENINANTSIAICAGAREHHQPSVTYCTPPTVDDVVAYGSTPMAGIPADFCRKWHRDMTDMGWAYKGQSYCTTPTSWRPKLAKWWQTEQEQRAKGKGHIEAATEEKDYTLGWGGKKGK